MKFTYIVGTHFTKLRLFFHKVCFINTLFPPLSKMLCAGHAKFFAVVSVLFTDVVFQSLLSANDILRSHPSGEQKHGSQSVLNWESREDEGEQILGADFCG
jgi:hypothetical protein